MKRTTIILSLIFALAIALSVSIPTLAATEDSSGTTVQGAVKAKVEISATAGPIDLGDLPNTATGAITVNVKCNKAWQLTASAPKMTDGINTLQNGLEAKNSLDSSWLDLSTTLDADALNSGVKTGGLGIDTDIDLRQTTVDYVDAASEDYETIITFTVTY